MNNTLTGFVSAEHPLITAVDPVAINTTATATADQMANGIISSTSAAAVTITTPTAASILSALGAPAGTMYEFVIDNSHGSNTVTLSLDASITALAVITGGNILTVANGVIGIFRLYFISTTAAKIARIA